ncbi:probable glycosyltransferase At5g03795 isoform X1 [Selaginella moellendorffii]|nr:probable glycosyltransferase At5g03795 isoform X1 [Selaginella moellendorffii]|eukprot:XP_002989572.2 probable glycosyltransferase At5g03795 isoform X1 [Selaginella moellendorffii]
MRALTSSAFCNVRSAIVIALLLVSVFVVLDSYTWRLLSVPWAYSKFASSLTGVNDSRHHARIVSPEEAEAAIAAATKEWQRTLAKEPSPPDVEEENKVLPETKNSRPAPASYSPVRREAPKKPDAELTSLQKLEAGMSHARAAIRNAVIHGLQEKDDLSPDVYLNATIFQQSYREMEKRLKVFAYPEGEEPLVHNGPCKEIYAIEGRFIQELQGKNSYLTSDPEKAHLFFLPFSVAMMVTYLYTPGSHDMGPLGRFTRDYIDVISHRYSSWNRSRGADHFMVSCHDWGPHISRAHPDLMANSIRVLCNANTSEGYVPSKDASLPEIHLVGGQVPSVLGGPPPEERRYLAFFAGGDHGPVRPVLFKYWKEKDEDVRVFEKLPSRDAYLDYMSHSKYCLCPGGYEVNSPRIVEAIYNDCVPVVIADDFVLPFSDVLDWDAFSVKVLERDIPRLKTILQAIPTARYLEMQARASKVRRHFRFNQPPERYDVFNMILHSVWLRRLNMIIHE